MTDEQQAKSASALLRWMVRAHYKDGSPMLFSTEWAMEMAALLDRLAAGTAAAATTKETP